MLCKIDQDANALVDDHDPLGISQFCCTQFPEFSLNSSELKVLSTKYASVFREYLTRFGDESRIQLESAQNVVFESCDVRGVLEEMEESNMVHFICDGTEDLITFGMAYPYFVFSDEGNQIH